MSSGARLLDVARVRGLFPGLSDGLLHADGPGGALMPESVVRAVSQAMRVPIANRGGVFASSARAEQLVSGARSAVADLVGGVPSGVVLGPSTTSLTYAFARALGKHWRRGDELVVSRLDHDANVRPWLQVADELGMVVKWAEVDIETGELPDWQYDELLTDRTRLVAVTAASNAIGTCPDVTAIGERAHRVGALVYVDAAHAAAHMPLDVTTLEADFLALSAYKWGGPHVGAVVAHPGLLEELRPDKLVPAPDRVPDRFEQGAPPFELYAGVAASVDHLAALCAEATGTRRDRLVTSMEAVSHYESRLFDWLDDALRSMAHVQVLGSPHYRTPTISFTVSRMRPRQVARELARRGVCAWDGDFYSRELFDAIGANEDGGAVRLGLMHYNTPEEVGHLIDHVSALR
ncbi:cysteine desulfurase-like protein [Modestobacter versicolor]|uniref:Cysteine desulfurase family protein (TIGR01976 family) n=1 Tax=Modestobacter versicolor TaxID=429133 RepID=A0A323VUX0_9ACTN|nr:cysteine desulfurase-like protein [Modestobacter versicolor]MBB3677059.1 cysteine desulfurase family protein (TIGR01976 family) [Modestobacter versicolor]PZA22638.1 cysteine desulfurase-like protein [Modestobacter versicolor]